MVTVSAEDRVLVALLSAGAVDSGGSDDTTGTASVSTVTRTVTTGDQQLGNQVEIAVAVSSLAEQGYINRETDGDEEYLWLTESGRTRAQSTRERLAKSEVSFVDGKSRETLPLADIAARVDDSLIEVTANCTEDGTYYLRDDVPNIELVGRNSQETTVHELLEEVQERGQGQALFLCGPSGVGKTTLVNTVLENTDGGVHTVRVHCQGAGGEPYQPIRDALDHLETTSPFTDVGVDADDPEVYDAQQTALFHDVTDTLAPDAGVRVLFLDDIDHADAATWAYIEYLLSNIEEYPLVFVGAHRPGALPEASPVSEENLTEYPFTRLSLSGLDRPETRTLIEQILSRRHIPADFVDAVYSRTDGNPLFVETTIDTLLESNQLDPGFQWYPDDEAAIDLPNAVTDTILQRLETLDSVATDSIQWVAVAGEFVRVTLLEELIEEGSNDVRTLVETLVDSELFTEEYREGGHWISIRNDVVREAVLTDLDAGEKQRRHAALAEALAANHQARSESASGIGRASTIAYHYEQAEEMTAAMDWYERAAGQTSDVYALETARDHFHSVLDIARSVDDTAAMLSAGHELAEISLTTSEYDQAERYVQFVRERLPTDATTRRRENARLEAELARNRGEFAAAVDAANEGLALTDEPDDVHCRLLSVKTAVQSETSDYDAAVETAQQYRALAQNLGETKLEAEASKQLALILLNRSEYDEAREYLETALEQIRDIGDRHEEAHIQNSLGTVAFTSGDPASAQEYYSEALETFDDIGDRHQVAKLYNNLGICASSLGDSEQAKEYYEQALDTGETIGDRHLIAGLHINLGDVERHLGNVEAAKVHAETAFGIYEVIESPQDLARAMNHLARSIVILGDLDEATDYLERTCDIYRGMEDNLEINFPLRDLAEIARKRGNFAAADEHLTEAEAATGQLDHPEANAKIAISRAWLAYRQNEFDKAYDYADQAREKLDGLGLKVSFAEALHALGTIEIERENYESASESLTEAQERYESDAARIDAAAVERDRGRLALAENDFERADELLQSALERAELTGAVFGIARTRYELGRLSEKTDGAVVCDHWKRALDIFEDVTARPEALDTLELLVSHCGNSTGSDALEWCDRGVELASELDTDRAAAKRDWFHSQRQQFE
jgi:tetratricopeptide (TPR) repeat protein